MRLSKPFFSIVVPIYRVEQYLHQCVDSILTQSFVDYELILVDDGSPDNCPAICDDYEKIDDRVRVIHKSNGGLSDARNAGIRVASGEYLLFIDADDYIMADSLDKIHEAVHRQNNPDIVFLQVDKIYPDGTLETYYGPMDEEKLSQSKECAIAYLASRKMYPASAWSKTVKNQVLKDNDIYFKVGQLSEDYEWTLSFLMCADSYGICNDKYYCYRKNREGSITTNMSEKHFNDLLGILNGFEEKSNEYPQYRSEILNFAAFIYRVLLWNSKPFYKNKKEEILKFKYLLGMKETKEIKLMRATARVFGIGGTINLLSLYRKIRK